MKERLQEKMVLNAFSFTHFAGVQFYNSVQDLSGFEREVPSALNITSVVVIKIPTLWS